MNPYPHNAGYVAAYWFHDHPAVTIPLALIILVICWRLWKVP